MKEESDTLTKFAADFLKAQQAMENASKDSTNPHFRSKFADLNSINDAVIPVLNAHNIMVLQPCVVVDGKKYIKTKLLHTSGEFLCSFTEILSAKELSAQDQGSGITYARRYGLQALVCIGAEDDDGEKAMGRKPETAKTTPKDTKIVASGASGAAASSALVKKEEPKAAVKTDDKPVSKFKPKPKVETTNTDADGF